MLQKDNVFSSKSFSLTLGSRIFGRRAQPLATWGTGRMWSFHVWNKHGNTTCVSWGFMMFHVCFFKILYCNSSCFSLHVFLWFWRKFGREKHNKIQLKARGYQPPCLVNLGTLASCVRSVLVAVPGRCFIVPIVARASDITSCHRKSPNALDDSRLTSGSSWRGDSSKS